MSRSAKKVVFVVTDYFPSTGGPYTTARAIARELLARGWSVNVSTRRLSRKWRRTDELDGVKIQRVGWPGYGRLAKLADLLGTWRSLVGMRRQTTVVHAFMDPDYAIAATAAGLGRRTVLKWATLGDPALYLGPRPIRALKVRVLRVCLHVALTSAMADELRQCGIHVDAVIPTPMDDTRFRPASPSQRAAERARFGITADVTIVFTGHLEPRKGIDHLLHAFGSLVEQGASVHLLIVGGNHGHAPDLGPGLREYVRARSLGHRVTFAGVVADVVPYLHASDIFCLPSTREGMSNSLVEAMACGLACIAPASAGGDDLLTEGAGVVPASNSEADLVAALTPLVVDHQLRTRLGRAAVARVQSHKLSEVVDAYEDLYQRIATERSRHNPSSSTIFGGG